MVKKITNSSERAVELKSHYHSLYLVINEHEKNKILELGLGANFNKYLDSVPDDIFLIWNFGEYYNMHSSKGKSYIQQAMKTKTMKDMIKITIDSLKDFRYRVKVEFQFGNDEETISMYSSPDEKMFEVKAYIVKRMNNDERYIDKKLMLTIFILKSMMLNLIMKIN